MSTPQTPAQILRGARNVIATPAHWTRSAEARDARGGVIFPLDPGAVRWCAVGALFKTVGYDSLWIGPAWGFLEGCMGMEIRDFNDSHKHADVLAAFDRAIAAAEEARP